MSEIFNDPYADKEDVVYPKVVPNTYSYDGSLAVFQVSYFNRGGIAVSSCMTHKVVDGYTICNFLYDWATIARNPSSKLPSRIFNGSSFYPPTKDDLSDVTNHITPKREECLSKSFYFSPSKLAALKAKIVSLRPPLPETMMGNDLSLFSVITSDENEMDLPRVVGKLRKAKEDF
ncbi:hypothetical protein BC332_12606 [Capsicum chinense]|nr:hypothetical protein BC332_12606 [Capsicum chinense]